MYLSVECILSCVSDVWVCLLIKLKSATSSAQNKLSTWFRFEKGEKGSITFLFFFSSFLNANVKKNIRKRSNALYSRQKTIRRSYFNDPTKYIQTINTNDISIRRNYRNILSRNVSIITSKEKKKKEKFRKRERKKRKIVIIISPLEIENTLEHLTCQFVLS